ncbi:hypothetical protein D3C86_1112100 [compost metagenome]
MTSPRGEKTKTSSAWRSSLTVSTNSWEFLASPCQSSSCLSHESFWSASVRALPPSL